MKRRHSVKLGTEVNAVISPRRAVAPSCSWPGKLVNEKDVRTNVGARLSRNETSGEIRRRDVFARVINADYSKAADLTGR